MVSWILIIFLGSYPIIIEGFTTYDKCEVAGNQISTSTKQREHKHFCIKVEK